MDSHVIADRMPPPTGRQARISSPNGRADADFYQPVEYFSQYPDGRMDALREILAGYDPAAPLDRAFTIPSTWYTDPRVLALEQQSVFPRSWQVVARVDQLTHVGDFVATELPDRDPIVIVRSEDAVVRAFFNVCRHHAAAVVTEPSGCARQFRCPYHGWTYALDGALKGTPDFAGVTGFDRGANGLVPLAAAVWERWVLVNVDPAAARLDAFLGHALREQMRARGLERFHWMERRVYSLDCNWKVFVDNYLDGGYHVPHLHKALDSVLDYSHYTIETGERHCLQSSPMVNAGADAATSAVRTGDRAYYYWVYPNFAVNIYADAMDTNLIVPRGVDRTDVVFDYYFTDVSASATGRNCASIDVSERIQDEDVAICESVQRGLRSRAYRAGRLSVRREAGEHLFHRLLYEDLHSGLAQS